MKCSVCGSDNLEGSAYCEDCGARLPVGVAAAAGGESAAPYTPAPPPPPPTPAPPPPAPTPEASPAPAPPPPPPTEEPAAAPAAGGTITCAACGAENPAFEAYCEDCGASLAAGGSSAGLSAPPPPPPVIDTPPTAGGYPPPPTPVQARPRLVLADGSHEFPLQKDEIAMGRRSPADGIYPDVDLTDVDTESYVSRRHGRIQNQESGFVFEDLGSSNGSFHNGNRMQPGVQAQLRDGDRLRLGKTEMVFRTT